MPVPFVLNARVRICEGNQVSEDAFRRRTYSAGTKIFEEGEQGSHAFLIERGRVQISANRRGSDFAIAMLGPGELFGELALIDDKCRSATATAVEETELVAIGHKQLTRKLDRADPMLALLLRVMLKRLRWSLHQVLGQESTGYGGDEQADTTRDRSLEHAAEDAISQIKRVYELDLAIEHRDFELFYQPIIRCSNGEVAGFEALIRWRHSERGLLLPVHFIALAEETGLIVPLGLWILEQACSDLQLFREHSLHVDPHRPPLFVSVNLSASQLKNRDEIEQLSDLLKRLGSKAESLKLEITESVLIETPKLFSDVLADLKRRGITLAIDDFGTGYSSLSYLHHLPVDTIKIDRSFGQTMLESYSSLQVVRAVIGLASELGIDVVAEGVVSVNQFQRLRELGCGSVQGFLFSEALPVGEALSFLEKRVDLDFENIGAPGSLLR
jgi:EAL domain-containing protein (putative c-di-GMP-specific phosphodiesterase class I)